MHWSCNRDKVIVFRIATMLFFTLSFLNTILFCSIVRVVLRLFWYVRIIHRLIKILLKALLSAFYHANYKIYLILYMWKACVFVTSANSIANCQKIVTLIIRCVLSFAVINCLSPCIFVSSPISRSMFKLLYTTWNLCSLYNYDIYHIGIKYILLSR